MFDSPTDTLPGMFPMQRRLCTWTPCPSPLCKSSTLAWLSEASQCPTVLCPDNAAGYLLPEGR